MASTDPSRDRLRLMKMLPSSGKMGSPPDFKLSRLIASNIVICISTVVMKPREFWRLTFLITIGTSMPWIGFGVGVEVGGGVVAVEVGMGCVAVDMVVRVRVGNSDGITVVVRDGGGVGLSIMDEISIQALLDNIMRMTSKLRYTFRAFILGSF